MPATLAESWLMALAAALGAAALSVPVTRGVLSWLQTRQILDCPNERSSHKAPTPRGGGLATTSVMALVVGGLALHLGSLPLGLLVLGALALLAISWLDDRHTLPALPRFLTHGAVIVLFLATLPAETTILGGLLPGWADRTVAGLGWLWFVNLYNFMDGIDGITGVETACLGLGTALVASVAGIAGGGAIIPAAVVVAAVGGVFLLVNWHPARIFLGDAGSVPFGFVLGGLLLLLAADGQLAAALILPAYYLADATITLGRRAFRGEKVWQAHRQHFYQRAVQGGKRHDQVSLTILAGNLLLLAAALAAAAGWVWQGTAAAVLIAAGLLVLLQRWSRS